MRFSNFLTITSTALLAAASPAQRLNKRLPHLQFFGINESGPEFGEGHIPGTLNTDYVWPDLSTIDTFIAKGMNTFRINILMERLIPNTLTGPLDSRYFAGLNRTVNYITDRGAYAMINPHNYGRYYGNVITDAPAFGEFWATVATPFAHNKLVIFDTNNEFHDESTANVAALNQAAINAIRSVGATTQYITVEGNAWTGAWTWTTTPGTDGLTNADGMLNLTDPSNLLIYQMHQYLDSDGSGTSTACVSETIGAERLVAATKWLRENKKLGFLGEFAAGANPTCQRAIQGLLQYLDDNADVWTGAAWWAAGPWWVSYIYSMEPTTGVAYGAYLDLIMQYA